MPLIDRPGAYRGNPTEWVVNETTNGFPQLVIRLNALEIYDEDGKLGASLNPPIPDSAGKWIPWNYGFDIVGYFVLVTKKGPTLNTQQIMSALGWDGRSFDALQNGEYANTMVLFRVEDKVYQGQPQRQATWIDRHDASPVRQLRTLDSGKFAAMQSKWVGQLSQVAAPPAAPAAPGAPVPAAPAPVAPVPGSPVAAPVPVAVQPQAVVAPGPAAVAVTPAQPQPQPQPAAPAPTAAPAATPKRGRGRPKGSKNRATASAPVASATPPPVVAPTPQQSQANVPCSKQECWDAVISVAGSNSDQDKLSELWVSQVQVHNSDGDDSQLTNEQWGQVRDSIITSLAASDDIPF